jgi:hypothetical protein
MGDLVAVRAGSEKQREVDGRWLRLVEEISPRLAKKVSKCGTEYGLWGHEDGHGDSSHRFWVAIKCRERNVCVSDARGYGKALVDDAFELVHAVNAKIPGKLEYVAFEFTAPKRMQLRIAADRDGLKSMRILGTQALQEVLGGKRYLLGGTIAAHWWHSSDPLKGVYPHVHGTLLTWAYDREAGRLVKVKGWIEPEILRRLAEVWTAKCEKKWGKVHFKGAHYVVHVHLSVGYGHLRHRLDYQFRRPVVDFFKYVRGLKEGLPDVDLSWVREALIRPRGENHIAWFGWMQQNVRKRYIATVNLILPKKRVRDKLRREKQMVCPRCGLALVYKRWVKPEIARQLEADGEYVLRYSPESYYRAFLVDWGMPE